MEQNSKLHKNQKGFTLIEAFMAVIILTVSLMGLAQLIVVAMERFEFAKYDTKAVHVAHSKMEELKSLYSWQIESGYFSSELEPGNHGPVLMQPESPDGSTGEPTDFWVTWEIQNMAKGQKMVVVNVRPPTLNPRLNEIVTLNSIFAP